MPSTQPEPAGDTGRRARVANLDLATFGTLLGAGPLSLNGWVSAQVLGAGGAAAVMAAAFVGREARARRPPPAVALAGPPVPHGQRRQPCSAPGVRRLQWDVLHRRSVPAARAPLHRDPDRPGLPAAQFGDRRPSIGLAAPPGLRLGAKTTLLSGLGTGHDGTGTVQQGLGACGLRCRPPPGNDPHRCRRGHCVPDPDVPCDVGRNARGFRCGLRAPEHSPIRGRRTRGCRALHRLITGDGGVWCQRSIKRPRSAIPTAFPDRQLASHVARLPQRAGRLLGEQEDDQTQHADGQGAGEGGDEQAWRARYPENPDIRMSQRRRDSAASYAAPSQRTPSPSGGTGPFWKYQSLSSIILKSSTTSMRSGAISSNEF